MLIVRRQITYFVYWLFDKTCSDLPVWLRRCDLSKSAANESAPSQPPPTHPQNFPSRMANERTKAQCMFLEKQLRPSLNIGWNFGFGGHQDGRGSKGVPKSSEQREKMRQAVLTSTKPGEKERTAKAVKKGLKNIDRTGAINPMFGKHMSVKMQNKKSG